MARLIDADDLIYEIRKHRKPGYGYATHEIDLAPTVYAVPVEQYKALYDMYHELRENFIDYVCSGVPNLAPYCLNKCEGCVDRRGWCKQDSDKCQGFNPAECII